MAAALLMMNMQGAVMAADKDMTIFRYSDKIPFAIITDPTSRLPWDDIWNEFRIHTNLSDNYVSIISDYLKSELKEYFKDQLVEESLFCVYYDVDDIFPHAIHLIIKAEYDNIEIIIGDASTVISTKNGVYINWLGDLSNTSAIIGDRLPEIEDAIVPTYNNIVKEFKKQLLDSIENETQRDKAESYLSLIDFNQELVDVFNSVANKQQENLENAISSYHIEDMVRMSERLIDAEGQFHHLKDSRNSISNTKEIATLTLAEGFRWIKHSLYGA